MKPEEVGEEVLKSGVRGRGGAGFPAGMKWKFLDRKSGKPIYLICNADESEPGTFKDRQIMYKAPHQLIEGMMIAAYAIGAKQAFIYIRAEFHEGARILNRAIQEAKDNEALDQDRREIIENRNNLDNLVYQTEKVLSENREKLPASEVETLEGELEKAREALDQDDATQLKAAFGGSA